MAEGETGEREEREGRETRKREGRKSGRAGGRPIETQSYPVTTTPTESACSSHRTRPKEADKVTFQPSPEDLSFSTPSNTIRQHLNLYANSLPLQSNPGIFR